MNFLNTIGLILILSTGAFAQEFTINVEIPEAVAGAKAYIDFAGRKDTINLTQGKGTFKGIVKEPLMAVIHTDYLNKGNFANYYRIFLTPGTTSLLVTDVAGTDKVKVIGSQYTMDFQYKLWEPVSALNIQSGQYYFKYADAKRNGSADTAMYLNQRYETIYNCFQIPQQYVKANPASPLCITALKMMGKGDRVAKVNAATLKSLFALLAPVIRESEDGEKYRAWLSKLCQGTE